MLATIANAELAYLATVESGKPHLSLMRFSLLPEPELGGAVLVLTTRRDTRKFEALLQSSDVAVLIHDIDRVASPHLEGEGGPSAAAAGEGATAAGPLSITLYGRAVICEGALGERLRARHLARNQAYAQFIDGPGIAVVAVQLTLARACNLRDHVSVAWAAAAAVPLAGDGSPTASM